MGGVEPSREGERLGRGAARGRHAGCHALFGLSLPQLQACEDFNQKPLGKMHLELRPDVLPV